MPKPNKGEKEKDFIARCIPIVLKDKSAKDNKQAVAMCTMMYKDKDKVPMMKNKAGEIDELDSTLPEDLKKATAGLEPVSDKESSVTSGGTETESMAGAGTSSENQSSTEQEPSNKEKTMADITKEDLRKEVEALLAEKDAKAAVSAKISGLEGEKATLSEQLKASESANKTLAQEKDSLAAELKTANEKNQALATEKEGLASKVTAHETELKKVREEQALAVRKVELEKATILFAEGEKRDKQLEKVRVMTDEAFASYKAELVEVSETAKASVKTAPAATATTTETAPEVQKATASVQVADVSDGDKYRMAIAAASESVKLDDDKIAQYAQM